MTGPPLREGDRVLLVRKNIKTKRPSNKLDFKKIGPFQIKRKISDVNYELSLPQNMRIHTVFHISLLEPAPPDAPLQEEFEATDEEYEVERILDHRVSNDQKEYYVKWKGYGYESNIWEPTSHLTNCQDLLR